MTVVDAPSGPPAAEAEPRVRSPDLDDGSTVDLSARIVQVKEDVGSGGTPKQGAIGAAIGGILGKVIGGTKGAIVGVLLGGAGGAITSTGDDVELPAGTVFTLQLERAATVPQR